MPLREVVLEQLLDHASGGHVGMATASHREQQRGRCRAGDRGRAEAVAPTPRRHRVLAEALLRSAWSGRTKPSGAASRRRMVSGLRRPRPFKALGITNAGGGPLRGKRRQPSHRMRHLGWPPRAHGLRLCLFGNMSTCTITRSESSLDRFTGFSRRECRMPRRWSGRSRRALGVPRELGRVARC